MINTLPPYPEEKLVDFCKKAVWAALNVHHVCKMSGCGHCSAAVGIGCHWCDHLGDAYVYLARHGINVPIRELQTKL